MAIKYSNSATHAAPAPGHNFRPISTPINVLMYGAHKRQQLYRFRLFRAISFYDRLLLRIACELC